MEGHLAARVSHREMVGMGLSENAKVTDFMVNGVWTWPSGVLQKWPELENIVPSLHIDQEDLVQWVSRNGRKAVFKSSIACGDFRVAHPPVAWYNLVWFSNVIPKHSFILWLAIKNKLLTQVRMQRWQTEGNLHCSFGNLQQDSVEYLFFECGFSKVVLRSFMNSGVYIPESLT